MAMVDYSHLVEIYRHHRNGLDLIHASIQLDHGYYCGSGKCAEDKARRHAIAVVEDHLLRHNKGPGAYVGIVYRVPPDSRVPVPKEDRTHITTVQVRWSPDTP